MLVTVYASETLEVSFSQIRAPRGEVGREKTILRSWNVGKWNENYITVRQLLLFNIWELSSTVFLTLLIHISHSYSICVVFCINSSFFFSEHLTRPQSSQSGVSPPSRQARRKSSANWTKARTSLALSGELKKRNRTKKS